MKLGNKISFVKRVCTVLICSSCFFVAGYYLGTRQSINGFMREIRSNTYVANEESGYYTAILSGKWIYVYNSRGALEDAVYVFSEYMTEEDKTALSNGVEFESAEKMRNFINAFK